MRKNDKKTKLNSYSCPYVKFSGRYCKITQKFIFVSFCIIFCFNELFLQKICFFQIFYTLQEKKINSIGLHGIMYVYIIKKKENQDVITFLTIA